MNFEPKLKVPENVLLSLKTLPTVEALQILQEYNTQMMEELSKKTSLLYEHNTKFAENEYKLNSLLHVIDEKTKQIEEESQLYKSDQNVESEYDSRLKQERHKRLSSLQEYQSKMAELRSIMKSSVVFNDELVKQEINEITQQIEMLSSEIRSCTQLYSATQTETLIDSEEENVLNNLKSLAEDFKSNGAQYSAEVADLETDLSKVSEEIKKIELNQ